MKLVSVVIPTHFRADRLAYAVESVQRQTWRNLEIIVVSDGKDTDTEKLMEAKKCEDSRIVFLEYTPCRGGNHARNIGIENSKGDFIAFLDDDDIWYEDKIERQIALFERDPRVGLVGCGIRVIHVERNTSYITLFREKGDLSTEILYYNIIGSTSCVMLRREAIDTCGSFDEAIPSRQDYDLWIRICQKYLVDFVDWVELDYYVHNDAGEKVQISKSLDKYLMATEMICNKYTELITSLDEHRQKEITAARFLSVAQRAMEVGDKRNTARNGMLAMKTKKSLKAAFFMLFFWLPYDSLVMLKSFASAHDHQVG